MIVYCTHSSVSYSAIITGASSGNKWAQIQKLTAIYYRGCDTLEHSALNGDVYINSSPWGKQGTLRKEFKSQREWKAQENKVL